VEVVGLGIAALFALGSFLLLSLFLEETLDLGHALHRRFRSRFRSRRSRLMALLAPQAATVSASADEDKAAPKRQRNLVAWLPAVGGLVGAILAHDVLLSPYLVVLGVGTTWASLKQAGAQASARVTAETGELVRAFQGIYAVTGSLCGALEEAVEVLPKGTLHAAVKQVIARYRAGDEDPFRPLRALPDPSLSRFVRVLSLIGQSDTSAIREALERLETRIAARKQLRSRVKVVLALMTGTLKILQGANLGAAVIAVTLPLWRGYFTATWGHRAIFVFATAAFALASAYFQTEKKTLQEQTL
jgi:hypothetical protein